jgi:hypothetical protein
MTASSGLRRAADNRLTTLARTVATALCAHRHESPREPPPVTLYVIGTGKECDASGRGFDQPRPVGTVPGTHGEGALI